MLFTFDICVLLCHLNFLIFMYAMWLFITNTKLIIDIFNKRKAFQITPQFPYSDEYFSCDITQNQKILTSHLPYGTDKICI